LPELPECVALADAAAAMDALHHGGRHALRGHEQRRQRCCKPRGVS
jgi:hypothetical protein